MEENQQRASRVDNAIGHSKLSVRRAGKEALAWAGIAVFALVIWALELAVDGPS